MSAADKTYEMKMKSAGAAVYEAWGLAVRSQPEYQGRKIDDKALVRIYESTKARPWWDKHLQVVKVEGKPADREWAKRTLQWHLDPDAARARRAQALVRSEAHHRRVKEAASAARPRPGSYSGSSNAPREHPTTAEIKKIVVEATWPAPRTVGKAEELGMGYGTQSEDEIDRLLARLRKVVRSFMSTDLNAFAEAEAQIRDLVENLENL
jgi:hypothetical protein